MTTNISRPSTKTNNFVTKLTICLAVPPTKKSYLSISKIWIIKSTITITLFQIKSKNIDKLKKVRKVKLFIAN